MTTPSDWIGMEDVITRLLPTGGVSPDPVRLLAELSAYARAVVRTGRCVGDDTPTADQTAKALSWLDRPVFLCGHHRSGTTLLQQLLDDHPNLVVLPSEGTYFGSFSYVARSDPQPQDMDRFVADWVSRLIDPNQEPHFKLGRSGPNGNPSVLFARRLLGWNSAVRRARPALDQFAPLLGLVAAYRDVVATSSTPCLWVEKTPLNEHNVERFAAFPQARFIQVVREPTATLASLTENYRKAGVREFDTAKHAQAIGRSLQIARKNTQRLGSRYLVLRYEDLTHDPVYAMERIRAFLGISPAPSLLQPSVGGRVVRSNSSFDRSDAGVVQSSRCRQPLSSAAASMINTLAGSAARALGYEVPRPVFLTRSFIHLRRLAASAFHFISFGSRYIAHHILFRAKFRCASSRNPSTDTT